MSKVIYAAFLGCLAITICTSEARSQTKAILFDGYVVTGYADHGAFINCAGPGIKFNKKPYSILLGLLPSLRIKEDKVVAGLTKNAAVTPNLGFGITAAFNHFALQLPFYYNTKTATRNGKWNPGIGLGYKF
ncbi:hypothetical protein [Pedobacter sp. MR2016-24]|uniref:hypothetical protein n=1 Tax=Pedobacter sp. MR2016-24 TaxID=2994466 RepID=UPI002246A279|nr:hypothetical protein [Pedobacter sp. MR2016-24]MCX2483990.1 hypothetical protein [Pedobacter sp. MR2016-24]